MVVAEAFQDEAARVHETLPIFRLSAEGGGVFYSPGYAVRVAPALAGQVADSLMPGAGPVSPRVRAVARELESHGRAACRAWQKMAGRPFEPECLTLILSNRCDLACGYCYAARGRIGTGPRLSDEIAESAARLVAGRCAAASRPLTTVFHGGGEPTLEWDLLVRLRAMLGRVAAEHAVPVWCHLATHGAIDESRAAWLAGHIDDIGLSCDGPPDVQDAQRPGVTIATSALVERTARVLRESGAAFTVRATVTPESVERQEEIVEYARERLGARRIRLEPAYRGRGSSGTQFRPEDAPRFVTHYVRAAETAKAHGCDVEISGARPGAIHGPYCNVLRGVVQVGPGNVASACFLDAGDGVPQSDHLPVGRVLPGAGDLAIDHGRVEVLRRRASAIPAGCMDCINVYHCARGCPDVCLATGAGEAADGGWGGFRCRVQRALTTWRVRQMAAGAITS